MKKILASLLVLSVASAAASRAADGPSSASQITPVSWVLSTQHNIDVDDKRVTLVGEVVKRDDGSDWWFHDTSGSVRLDAGDKELPVGRRIVITGNIDQSRFGIGHLEVEVKHWEYAK